MRIMVTTATTLLLALGLYGCGPQVVSEVQSLPRMTVYDDDMNRCVEVGTQGRTDIDGTFVSLSNLLAAYASDVRIGDVCLSFNFGDDSMDDFVGDPINGGYALPSATVIAANNYMAVHASESKYRASNVTGIPWSKVRQNAGNGVPTLIWLTSDMRLPDEDGMTRAEDSETIYPDMHTYVVIGFDGGKVELVDPASGVIEAQESKVSETYDACGQKAVLMQEVG